MNTIPLTFDEDLCNCTILGGTGSSQSRYPVSVLLLGRNAGNLKSSCLDTLIQLGFESVISIENPKNNYKMDSLSKKYPEVTFVIPCENITVGEMINLGMSVCKSKFLFVMWDDFSIKNSLFSDAIMSKLESSDAVCYSPVFFNSYYQSIPVNMKPGLDGTLFTVYPSNVVYDNTKTLFPFDFAGIYHKEKFMNVCGFDKSITRNYWQLLDFACRANLWGEKIITSPIFRIVYQNDSPIMDSTLDYSYFRFYLKNIAPIMKVDYAYVPFSRFTKFHWRSIYSFRPAIKEFNYVRKWVARNKFRFKTDMEKLIKSWESVNPQ